MLVVLNKNNKHYSKQNLKPSGFTVVELLIVIVVIGILTVISIVTYSGIQDRARNTATQQTLTNAKKSASLTQVSFEPFIYTDRPSER